MTMTEEQHRGAMLFVDAIERDMENSKTHKIAKIGLKLKLSNAIKANDDEKVKQVITTYNDLMTANEQTKSI